ncbi:MAG: ferredoxin [Natronomonas sp.]|jgi:ferredoxin|uniref:ferredoxin Fer n=1 Tax=Natronomonas sp. TaxID=2184060 RepID=UPI003988D521
MGIDLPAVEPETSSEDRPPSRVEYLDYRAVARHEWGLEDDDLFEKAAAASIPEERYGSLEVPRDEPILVAATDEGLAWPSSCRAGSCATCTAYLYEGEADMDINLLLTDEEIEERGLLLTCTATPESDELKVVFNAVMSPYVRETVLNR